MEALAQFHAAHPFWAWASIAALLLAIEVGTGTEMLLWPSASAGVTALFALTPLDPGLAAELGLFAVLTLVTTLVSRRFIARAAVIDEPDINDPLSRIVGHTGAAVGPFVEGRGRVFVDGKEWAAEAQDDTAIAAGGRVEVVGVVNGVSLRVRAV